MSDHCYALVLLAHLSRRLTGELIDRQASVVRRRPSSVVVRPQFRLSTDSYIPIKLLYFGSKSYIFKHLLYTYKFSYILKICPIFLGKFVADEYLVNSKALILPFASLFFILYFF